MPFSRWTTPKRSVQVVTSKAPHDHPLPYQKHSGYTNYLGAAAALLGSLSTPSTENISSSRHYDTYVA